MPQIEIRPTEPDDIAVLQQIDHSYQTARVWQMERQVIQDQVKVRFNQIKLPRTLQVDYPRQPRWTVGHQNGKVTLAALNQGNVVGYIRLQAHITPDSAWITDMVVRDDLRRQGIGSGMVLAGHDWAVHQGLRRMVIEMQSKNYPAVEMAIKLGYEFNGYHDSYYANHDIALFYGRFLH
jgi:ribosomal protein S18 acetylase RimI-like enzyme